MSARHQNGQKYTLENGPGHALGTGTIGCKIAL
jgi:hypothetical protein